MPFQPIVTAVPNGTRWRVKILTPESKIKYRGDYATRADALRAAAEIAPTIGGQYVP